jgi:hypothetical protein
MLSALRRSVGPRKDLGGTIMFFPSHFEVPDPSYRRAGDTISLSKVNSQLRCDSLKTRIVCRAPSLPIWQRPLSLSSQDRTFTPGGDQYALGADTARAGHDPAGAYRGVRDRRRWTAIPHGKRRDDLRHHPYLGSCPDAGPGTGANCLSACGQALRLASRRGLALAERRGCGHGGG